MPNLKNQGARHKSIVTQQKTPTVTVNPQNQDGPVANAWQVPSQSPINDRPVYEAT